MYVRMYVLVYMSVCMYVCVGVCTYKKSPDKILVGIQLRVAVQYTTSGSGFRFGFCTFLESTLRSSGWPYIFPAGTYKEPYGLGLRVQGLGFIDH